MIPHTQLTLYVDRERKAAYVRAAKPGDLVQWIINTLDNAAGYAASSNTPIGLDNTDMAPSAHYERAGDTLNNLDAADRAYRAAIRHIPAHNRNYLDHYKRINAKILALEETQ